MGNDSRGSLLHVFYCLGDVGESRPGAQYFWAEGAVLQLSSRALSERGDLLFFNALIAGSREIYHIVALQLALYFAVREHGLHGSPGLFSFLCDLLLL